MRYGLNQVGFPTDDFDVACRIAATAGFDGVEPNYVEGGLLSTPGGHTEARKAVDDYGLAVPAVSTTAHWEYPLSSPDDTRRDRGIEIGKSMIDAADHLDASYVLIVPAVIRPGIDYDAAYHRAVDAVQDLVRYADGTGVDVTVENVRNNFLYAPVEFERFISDVEDAGPVKVYFDIGNARKSGLPERWIRELAPHIARIHVKDWMADAHDETYPLQGNVDWGSVRSTLADVDYDGWLTAEVPPYESHPERTPADVLDTMQFLFGQLTES